MKVDQIAELERLVDELMKTKPNQSQVQTYMRSAGLSYSTDPVEQLSSVLSYLQTRRELKPKVRSEGKPDEPTI